MLVIISVRLDSTASLKLVHATTGVFDVAVHIVIAQIQVSEVFSVGRSFSLDMTPSDYPLHKCKQKKGGGGSLDLPMTDSILTECRV